MTKAAKDKIDIVRYDAFEKGMRKNLNFGHSIGHAFESYFLKINKPITHGKAIAAGMICESWISSKLYGADCVLLPEIESMIDSNFSRLEISTSTIPVLLDLMRQDIFTHIEIHVDGIKTQESGEQRVFTGTHEIAHVDHLAADASGNG